VNWSSSSGEGHLLEPSRKQRRDDSEDDDEYKPSDHDSDNEGFRISTRPKKIARTDKASFSSVLVSTVVETPKIVPISSPVTTQILITSLLSIPVFTESIISSTPIISPFISASVAVS
jgi:hypothetical protein